MSQARHSPELQFFNGRRSMRTVADGLEKLDELQPNLGDPISVKTLSMRLPNGESTAIVVLIGPETSDDARWAIALPSSAQFSATTTLGAPQSYDIARLNDATVDIRGNVCLTNGVYLHNVELVPTETGNYFGGAGNSGTGTGDFTPQNRNHRRMRFSVYIVDERTKAR